MTKKEKEARRLEAIAYLRSFIKAGDDIMPVLTHVSSNGMSRRFKVFAFDERQKGNVKGLRNISRFVSEAMGYKWNGEGSIVVGGCGMDMAFSVVYGLGSTLFGHGKDSDAPKQNYITGRNGDTEPETDGGYLLRYARL